MSVTTASTASAPTTAAPAARPLHPIATIAVTLLSVVTAISMSRLFADWDYLPQMVLAVVGAHAISLAIRATPLPSVAAIPLVVIATIWLVALVYHRDTTVALLPTGETIDALRSDLRLVWEQFPKAVAPVPSGGSFAVASGGLLALCAPLADSFAFRAFGRAEAVVPTAIVFIFVSALSTPNHRVLMAALWIATALLVIAVLRSAHRDTSATWAGGQRARSWRSVPAPLAAAAIAGLAAAAIAPSLPGAGKQALIDTRNRLDSDTEVVSPLVDIRSQLVTRSDVLLFTVRSEQAHYWRLIGLSDFDGRTWKPGGEDLQSRAPNSPSGTAVDTQITLRRLGGVLLPVAYRAASWSDSDFDWAPQSQAMVFSGDTLPVGRTIQVTSFVGEPTMEQLATATAASPPSNSFLRLPSGLPDEVINATNEVTGGQPTAYAKARALQDWFRTNFTYDLSVQAGHSNDAIRDFLEIRRGYCEQFAATFAAMARLASLPARVAVGFTTGTLASDGTYEVRGRQAHAWPEVWFDGYGWVAFEPTPGRGQPGSEAVTGVSPNQDDGGANSGQATPTDSTVPPSSVPASAVPSNSATTTTVAATAGGGQESGLGAGWILALLAVAALIAWPVLMPRLIRDRRRRAIGDDPRSRISFAWQRARRALDPLVDAPEGSTPTEFARYSGSSGVDHELVSDLATTVTEAVYADTEVDPHTAQSAEDLGEAIVDATRRQQTLRQRVGAAIDPRQVV